MERNNRQIIIQKVLKVFLRVGDTMFDSYYIIFLLIFSQLMIIGGDDRKICR